MHEDLVRGVGAIATFLFGSHTAQTRRKVTNLSNHHDCPFFYLGGPLCVRRSAWMSYIEQKEREYQTEVAARKLGETAPRASGRQVRRVQPGAPPPPGRRPP